QVAQAKADQLRNSLSIAFMLNSAIRRDAERVTATEIIETADELESTFGGVYSLLATEMQRPRIQRLTMQLQDSGGLPPWPEGSVEPTIVTGLEALKNSKTLQNITRFTEMSQALDPQGEYVKKGELLGKSALALGLGQVIRTEAEVEEQRNREAQRQAMMRGQPGMEPEVPAEGAA